MATIIAISCLVCMGLPLTITQKNLSGSTAIILTAGTNNDSVQHYKYTSQEMPMVYQADDFFTTEHASYDSLQIFGYGLSFSQLESLGNTKLIFHPSKITTGITDIDWNRKVKKAAPLFIQGSYTNTTSEPISLLLSGFNTVLDSFIVPAKQIQSFRLNTVPKQSGRAVYSLFAIQGKDTLEKEPVPVEVITTRPIKVCMLAASPDFENKFLKDWLSQNGYTVVTKTTISANKYDRAFFNAGNISADHFTSPMLDSFDVLISDEAALLSLSKSERENIYRQISQKGMGLLVKADTITASAKEYTRSFRLYTLPGKQPSQLSLHLMQGKQNNIVLPVEQPLFIRYQEGTQPMIADSTGNIVAGAVVEGAGKIVLTTLTNTYSWLLAGKSNDYYAMWSALLQKAARQDIPGVSIEIVPQLAFVQQPVNIMLSTNYDTLPDARINGKRLALAQNKKVAYLWNGIYWPLETGWQPPVTIAGTLYNWYAFNTNDWQYIIANSHIHATKFYSQRKESGSKNKMSVNKPLQIPVSLVYFFLPFILSCGFLWMERKLF
ncbi:MAG: hypothetical protein ABIS69_00280 [Sediminibacterium sp.]